MDVCESIVAALEAEREAEVIKSEEMEDGGVQIVDVEATFGGAEAEFVGGAVEVSGFEPTAGCPHGEGVDVVIASGSFAGFTHWCAAEFATPNHECVFEESAFPEIFDECSGGLIDFAADLIECGIEVGAFAAVVVPVRVVELDEADAAFDHAAGEEAVVGKGCLSGLGTVHFEGVFGFLIELCEFRGGDLHGEGGFVGFDACLNFGVADFGESEGIEAADGAGEVLL